MAELGCDAVTTPAPCGSGGGAGWKVSLCRCGPQHPSPVEGCRGNGFTCDMTLLSWRLLGRGGGADAGGGRTGQKGAPSTLTMGRGVLTARILLTNCLCSSVMRNCELNQSWVDLGVTGFSRLEGDNGLLICC